MPDIASISSSTAAMPTAMPIIKVSKARAIRKGWRFLAGGGTGAAGAGGSGCEAEGSAGAGVS